MTEIRTAPSRGLALGAALALITAGLLGTAYLARPDVAKADSHSAMPTSRTLEATSGIRILSAHIEGDGGLIDVRYQVLDPNKANVVEGDPTNTPAIVPTGGGETLTKTAAMRKGHERREAGTYFLIYYNRGDVVHSGDFVDITFDGVTLTHVPVT